ncbi:MAG: hypothetical protein JY451_13655 [Erythrobacter sp.]|nr:MAG: hypothetical protein JY451_13655 [Erythrobacter sp.]
MRWIGNFIAGLWRYSRVSWVSVSDELRPRSGASALYLFFFLIFAVVAVILLLLGVDLDDASNWIDAQGGWLDAVGTALFQLLCGVIVFVCAVLFGGGAWHLFSPPASKSDRIGWGTMIGAALVGYFAWFGLVG